MFTTSQKIECISQIEAGLTIPDKNYFVKNETSIRLCYFKGKEIKYINLPSHEDVANFLKKHGVIRFYSIKDENVTMYTTILHTIVGDKGQPVQQERMVQLRWIDIDISPSQVLHYAAEKEFEEAGGTMGMIVRKITGKKTA